MAQSDDYSQNQVPDVFVELAPTVEPRRGGVSRGQLAVISLVLFGALVASTTGLMMIRSSEQADWARARQKLESDRSAAIDHASRLDVAKTQLAANLEQVNAKVEKYGAIEYQLNLIREKTQQIQDLRKAKPSYPHQRYMNIEAVPEWSAPGENLLKDFVAKLDTERANLIAFKESTPPGNSPTTPQITSAPK